jgi:hypothetical protein
VGRKLRIDMTGQRYGRLLAIAFDHCGPSGHAHWLFRCYCGREVVACGGNVRAGSTSSCGCLHRELSAARLTEHGERAAKRHEPTYRAWQQMRLEPAAICHAWDDYAAFAASMGQRPAGTKLARRSASRPFAPGNCLWAPVETRAARAARGWVKRRLGADYAEGARAASSQSRSSPAVDAIIRASTLR